MRRLRWLWVGALVLSSCVAGPTTTIGGVAGSVLGLRSFSGCEDLLAYVKGHALERVTAWGLPGVYGPGSFALEDAAVAADAGGAVAASGPVAGEDYSTTNVQTAGVDEPDIVKTDGERLVVLAGDLLVVFDVTGGGPERLGALRLEDVWPTGLLLSGDRALVLGDAAAGHPVAIDGPGYGSGSTSTFLEIDLSDPSAPAVTRRLSVDGRSLSARMQDGVVRLVMSAPPTALPFVYPERGGLRAERDALEANREVIRASTLEDWVPYYVLEDAAGGVLDEGSLLDCTSARRPGEYSGLGMLSVLTLDLAEGLTGSVAEGAVGVLAEGETIYASTESLYVATQRWMDWTILDAGDADVREGFATQIHRFDISGEDRAEYRASGEVPGWLLNQFAMDEHEGHLRVASTDAPSFWDGPSESMVTTLAERDGRLTEVGQVAGLGRGERIFSVRFIGDLGYVVTFREVDPLYVVDLADPASPHVVGELKIPGYSAYLHPLGDGKLLGVGQDANLQGQLRGTQISLFDVTDPSAPERLDTLKIADGSSEAEWDHHAFLSWEPEGLVVLPLSVYPWEEGATTEPFTGAIAARVRGDRLREAGRIEHERVGQDSWTGIRRSLVIGDLLYTVSDAGLEAADLATLEEVAWVAFH